MNRKIGIITFHNAYNYGAILQAYALFKVLENENAECIDYIQADLNLKYHHQLYNRKKSFYINIKHFLKYYILRKSYLKERKMKDFLKANIRFSNRKFSSFDELKFNSGDYDILISGSDQIWNPELTGGTIDKAYLLQFGNTNAKRISYASSAGSYVFNDEERGVLSSSLSLFERIGVRENFLKEQLNEIINKEIDTVLDPTLLLTSQEWQSISRPYDNKKITNFVLLYTFDDDLNAIQSAKMIADDYGLKLISIAGNIKKQPGVDLFLADVGPEEFIWLFDNAKFVITNSYHGTIFSVIFKKEFYSIKKKSNPERVQNLLMSLGIAERIISDFSEIGKLNKQLNFVEIEKKLKRLKIESREFLFSSISN